MKRIVALLLALLIVFSFVGCKKKEIDPAVTGGKNGERVIFNYDMSKYITVGTYKGITVDKSSDTYKNNYEGEYEGLLTNQNAYIYQKEGVLKKNDVAMIEFVGKIDGKTFIGGSSESEGPLKLGSGTFIPGFEDGLIGKSVGTTVVLNLKFPDDYTDELAYFTDDTNGKNGFSLNGKPVEFTVKVNSIKITPEKNDDTAKKLGFENKDALLKHLEKMAIEYCVLDDFFASKDHVVKSYPETEKKNYDEEYNAICTQAEQTAKEYNAEKGTSVTLEDVLTYTYGYDTDGLSQYFQNILKQEMIMYAVFDAENLSYTEQEYNDFLAEMAKSYLNAQQTVTVDMIKEQTPSWQLEASMIFEKAKAFIIESAQIK